MWKLYFLIVLAITLEIGSTDESQALKVGNTINICTKCNYWAATMGMLPPNSRLSESSTPLFDNIERKTETYDRPLSIDDYSVQFCDNKDELLAAYFSGYSVQGSIEPWRIFIDGWDDIEIATMLGIHHEYLRDGYKYILIKLTRQHKSKKIATPRQQLTLRQPVSNDLSRIHRCNGTSVRNFVTKHGTHYVNSYTTGNFIYQVNVLSEANYTVVKDVIGRLRVDQYDHPSRFYYFSPQFTLQNGRILSASGDKDLDGWLTLATGAALPKVGVYRCIMTFYYVQPSMETLSKLLTNVTLIKLDLILLSHIVAEREKRICLMRAINDRCEYLL